jgi:acyl-CoA reductase-like NAD-dependent aldehyde dehydrogenase
MATATAQQMFFGGDWRSSASGETFEAISPATGELIGTIPQGDRDDARRAIAAARAAADRWARLTAFERAAKMHAVGDIIESRRDELARTLTLDQGKPLRAEAYDEVDELVEYWRMAAEDAKRLGGELPNSFSAGKRVMLVRRPRGVVGVISPWNWPYTMPAELIAPALACGNAVVWTPAPSTAMCAVALARCIADADLPPGVFNLVTGPGPVVGDEIARNPGTDGVAFIGSTATGRLVAQAAAGKATLLEMGGNGPLVVMDDADLDAAADATLTACYLCAGQSCTAGERLLVHRSVKDEFASLLARRVTERILLGDPFAERTTMGPLNNEPVAVKMDEHVQDALQRGARVVSGGGRATGFPTSLYWEPTVLVDVPADARVAVEETFGPIAPVVSIESLKHAISLTNSSPYGLLSAIFTADLANGLRFADHVRTGWVNINESSNYWEAHLPFGGRSGSDSGIGRVGGPHVMYSFTELQTVVLTPPSRSS